MYSILHILANALGHLPIPCIQKLTYSEKYIKKKRYYGSTITNIASVFFFCFVWLFFFKIKDTSVEFQTAGHLWALESLGCYFVSREGVWDSDTCQTWWPPEALFYKPFDLHTRGIWGSTQDQRSRWPDSVLALTHLPCCICIFKFTSVNAAVQRKGVRWEVSGEAKERMKKKRISEKHK